MGAFDKKKEILIPNDEKPEEARAFRNKWGWDAHEQITLLGRMTAGIQEDVANASTSIEDSKPSLLAGTGRNVMLERMIVRWTLTQNGHPVDVTLDTIRELPTEYSTPLLEVCDQLAAATMSTKAQKDFLASANGHTKANLEVVK